jgi:pimeloyl-ACP methyl ester carboxylesterase
MESGVVGDIAVEGRRLAWRTVGSGAPLLLINGYAATAEDWDPAFLDGLAESFEVICPDNRGVGFSMRSPGIFDGLAALGLSISGEQGGGCPMSGRPG